MSLTSLPGELLWSHVVGFLPPPAPRALNETCKALRNVAPSASLTAAWLAKWYSGGESLLQAARVCSPASHSTLVLRQLVNEHGHGDNLTAALDASSRRTLLHIAALRGHTDAVAYVLATAAAAVGAEGIAEGPNPEWLNAVDRGGATALGLACLAGHIEVVRLLLAQPGVEANVRTGRLIRDEARPASASAAAAAAATAAAATAAAVTAAAAAAAIATAAATAAAAAGLGDPRIDAASARAALAGAALADFMRSHSAMHEDDDQADNGDSEAPSDDDSGLQVSVPFPCST